MPETAKNDVQSPWNCHWARLAQRVVGIDEQEPPGDPVCVRPRRGSLTVECDPPSVTQEECAGCEFWEPYHNPRATGAEYPRVLVRH